MANTTQPTKSRFKSVNFWATILTILTGVAGVFAVVPDPASAGQLTDITLDAVAAAKEKNWYVLGALVIQSANFLYHTFIRPLIGK